MLICTYMISHVGLNAIVWVITFMGRFCAYNEMKWLACSELASWELDTPEVNTSSPRPLGFSGLPGRSRDLERSRRSWWVRQSARLYMFLVLLFICPCVQFGYVLNSSWPYKSVGSTVLSPGIEVAILDVGRFVPRCHTMLARVPDISK